MIILAEKMTDPDMAAKSVKRFLSKSVKVVKFLTLSEEKFEENFFKEVIAFTGNFKVLKTREDFDNIKRLKGLDKM